MPRPMLRTYLGMLRLGWSRSARQPSAQKAYAPWASAFGWPEMPPSNVWPEDGLALIEGWWSASCFSLLTSPDIVCHARQEVCAAVFGMCQRLGGQVKRKSQEGNDNSCAVCAPFSGG